MNPFVSDVSAWLKTDPECFKDKRVILKRDVLASYNEWARKKKGRLKCSPIAMGICIKALFPGVVTIQIREKGNSRPRAFVLPITDDDDLL